MSKTLQEHHNDGQSDASNNKYEVPHGSVEELLTWNSDSLNKLYEDNNAYRDGHQHTTDQKK